MICPPTSDLPSSGPALASAPHPSLWYPQEHGCLGQLQWTESRAQGTLAFPLS